MARFFVRAGVWMVAAGLVAPACSSGDIGLLTDYSKDMYIGGKCGVDDEDCHTSWNDIPGSFCHEHECKCPSGMDKCCPGGQWDALGNPLNCKVDDNYRCRGWSECHPLPDMSLPPAKAECETAESCPRPPDLRCGEATCEKGKCGIKLFPNEGPIAWQSPGDCKTAYCDETGNVVLKEDTSDVPKTADPCLADSCKGSEPAHKSVGEGEACIDTTGLCYPTNTTSGPMLRCVECIFPYDSPCFLDHVCAGLGLNYCVPPFCTNNVMDWDGGETDVDCGGPLCAPCPVTLSCFKGSDCLEGVCNFSTCAAPAHDDGVKNDGETGLDCGCTKCPICPDGEGCTQNEHCASGVCYIGKCQAPTCFDMVQNGVEQGVDCGGECELACPLQSSSG